MVCDVCKEDKLLSVAGICDDCKHAVPQMRMKPPTQTWKEKSIFEDDGSFSLKIDQVDRISTKRKHHKIGSFDVIEVSKIIDMTVAPGHKEQDRLTFTHLEVESTGKKYKVVVQATEVKE